MFRAFITSLAPRVYNDVGHYSTVAATRPPSPQLEEAHIAPLPYRQRESSRDDQTLTNEELVATLNSALGTGELASTLQPEEVDEEDPSVDNSVPAPETHQDENQSDQSDLSAHSTGELASTLQPEEVYEEDPSVDNSALAPETHQDENQSDQSDLSAHSTGAGESTCENQSDESEPQSKGDDQGEGYKLIKILTDPNRQCHYHDDCGNVAQSEWRDQADGSIWPYCEYCQKEEFFKNDKSIRGNWPPANEVAKECIVDGVCQWRWRSGREEEVICNGCHDKHMEAPRVKKRRRDGGVSRSYQKRDENYHDGYYVTQKWYKENFDLERCSSCKKYMRPVDLGDDEEDN